MGSHPSPSSSSYPFGVRLLEPEKAHSNGRPLPRKLVAAPNLVSGLYDEVKGQLPIDFQ